MDNVDLTDVIRSSRVIVRSERYAYLKTQTEPASTRHFLITRDKDEITIVTEEANVLQTSFEKEVGWFNLIEVRVSQPFVAKGFISRITQAISERDLNVLVVSTFSKDYFLVREECIDTAISALRELGFPLSREESEKP